MHFYDQPHQFEPLLPQRDLEGLVLATREVIDQSAALSRSTHESTLSALSSLVRSMNSYYSNLIEGQNTHPLNIDNALRQDFSGKPEVARRQRIAIAHIEAEEHLEAEPLSEADALHSRFLVRAHAALYSRLKEDDRRSDHGPIVEPGQFRTDDVQVGRHVPPRAQAVQAFLSYADERYARRWGYDAILYVIASAHQRMAWVHPFLDGNGRACRLQTHCALLPLSKGLWSVSRGLARQRDAYYAFLSDADMPRHGDVDGRGNLSESMLREWCAFFIGVCRDQASFMGRMLDLKLLKERMRDLIVFRSSSTAYADYKDEAVLPMQFVLAAGPVSRGEFARMSGLPERSASRVIARLLADGLLTSKTSKGPVGIGLPLDALAILFPNLYPEAATLPSPDDQP